jgi:hypothetical protein
MFNTSLYTTKYVRLLIEMMICLQWNADAQYFKLISSLTSLWRLHYSNNAARNGRYKLFVNLYAIQLISLLKWIFLAISQVP